MGDLLEFKPKKTNKVANKPLVEPSYKPSFKGKILDLTCSFLILILPKIRVEDILFPEDNNKAS